jgi:hypothetical protein
MRSAWTRAIVAVGAMGAIGLAMLALACRPAEESADRPVPPAAQAEAPGPEAEPADPNAPPLIASAVPGAPVVDGIPLSSTPPSCDAAVEVLRVCWTETFPPDVSGGSDVACRFTLQCCGTAVQRWTRSYPKSAGPSGIVFNDSVRTTTPCRDNLADLDGDGTPNPDDPQPLPDRGETGYPWN